MTVKARIVGPKEDLGPIGEDGLVFFGHRLSRDWSEIEPRPDVLEKLRGNRHVELSGAPAKPDAKPAAEAPAPEPDEESALRAELADLGVAAKPGASLKVLKMALGKARKAHASAAKG